MLTSHAVPVPNIKESIPVPASKSRLFLTYSLSRDEVKWCQVEVAGLKNSNSMTSSGTTIARVISRVGVTHLHPAAANCSLFIPIRWQLIEVFLFPKGGS